MTLLNAPLLSTAYLPNIRYITKLLFSDEVWIEKFENYQKQSYRNRCIIYGANGPLTLVIPVKKDSGKKTQIKDIQIDYSTRWQHQHWKSIHSAYKNSPYFDYYEDEFQPFYIKKELFLFDYNTRLLERIIRLLGIKCKLYVTSEYVNKTSEYDYRNAIHPKRRLDKADPLFSPAGYHQVFSDRSGFVPNAGIIDLMFNAGPESIGILKRSVQKKGQ